MPFYLCTKPDHYNKSHYYQICVVVKQKYSPMV